MRVSGSKTVARLVDDLFAKIERPQGFAFFSDGETFRTRRQLLHRVRGRLGYAREVVRIYEQFLKQHEPPHA